MSTVPLTTKYNKCAHVYPDGIQCQATCKLNLCRHHGPRKEYKKHKRGDKCQYPNCPNTCRDTYCHRHTPATITRKSEYYREHKKVNKIMIPISSILPQQLLVSN